MVNVSVHVECEIEDFKDLLKILFTNLLCMFSFWTTRWRLYEFIIYGNPWRRFKSYSSIFSRIDVSLKYKYVRWWNTCIKVYSTSWSLSLSLCKFSFRQKSNVVQVPGDDGAFVKTIYTGKSTKFAAYLIHYEVDQVPIEPPPIIRESEFQIPESCKITMHHVWWTL